MIVIVLIAIAFVVVIGVVWHYLLGIPNGPLPKAQVGIVASSAYGAPSAAGPSGNGAASSTNVDIPNPTLPEEQLSIASATWTVEMATTVVEQTRGLSYRPSLAPDTGMLFVFPRPGVQNFWMKDMHFPLDMIWISANGTVAGFVQDAPAPASSTPLWNLPIYTSPAGVQQVLEVNAGTVARDGIRVGDAVTVRPL